MANNRARWLHTPCSLGFPNASERGTKLEVAHNTAGGYITSATWGSQCFKAGDKIRGGPDRGHGGYVAPACWMVPNATEQGTKSEVARKWGLGGYITCAAGAVPNALERGTKSEVAHKCKGHVHNPSRLGVPQRFREGDKHRGGPQ